MLQEHRDGLIATSACPRRTVANNFLHGNRTSARLRRQAGGDPGTGPLLHRDPGPRDQGARSTRTEISSLSRAI
jgi:hypothetical protein